MFIAIYRDKETGEIDNVHEVKKMSIGEADEATKAYNGEVRNVCTVEMQRIDDGLEAFLFAHCMFDKESYIDDLECIKRSVEDLVSRLASEND